MSASPWRIALTSLSGVICIEELPVSSSDKKCLQRCRKEKRWEEFGFGTGMTDSVFIGGSVALLKFAFFNRQDDLHVHACTLHPFFFFVFLFPPNRYVAWGGGERGEQPPWLICPLVYQELLSCLPLSFHLLFDVDHSWIKQWPVCSQGLRIHVFTGSLITQKKRMRENRSVHW